jgi:hypothetical protein
MVGGIDTTTYIVDNVNDVIVHVNRGYTGNVQASVSYTLSEHLYSLTLTGSDHINATGNGERNNLVGNSGNNVLRGLDEADALRGGAGNDTLIGGNGWDNYYYGLTDGLETIDNSSTDAEEDYLNLQAARSNFTLSRSGNDLLIANNASATANAVRVTNWFLGESWQIDNVGFADQQFTNEAINAMFGENPIAETALTQSAFDEAALAASRFIDAMNHFGTDRHWVAPVRPSAQTDGASGWLHVGVDERSGVEHHGRVAREALA